MRQCANCGKGSVMGGTRRLLRGHYNPTTKSRKYPNLQLARLPSLTAQAVSGQAKVGGVRKLICVQCIKTLNRKPRTKKAAK